MAQRPQLPYPSSESEALDDAAEAIRNSRDYHDLVSALPRDASWFASWLNELVKYQGFWLPDFHLPCVLAVQRHFSLLPTDILLATYPKSGTTWLKALAFAVLNRAHCSPDTHPLLTLNPHECVPFVELRRAGDRIPHPDSTRPRLLATHLPYSLLPPSVHDSGCRVVYVSRDPRDVFISLWHFMNKIRREPLSLSSAFEKFCAGISPFGPPWDHKLDYWKESLVRPENVLFLKYEDMMREPVGSVKRLAEFMGSAFSEEEEMRGAVEQVLSLCSFKNLSRVAKGNKARGFEIKGATVNYSAFFRKGEAGDWKNHLTSEMAERLDNIYEEKLHGSDVGFQPSDP